MAEKKFSTEKKFGRARFWGQKGPKNRNFEKSFFTLKDGPISILCTKIQHPSLYRFLKFAKDSQNMTPRKKIFGDFFGKKGGKSQNFEKSFDTP